MERLFLKHRKSVSIIFLLVVFMITLIAVGTALAIPDTEFNIDKNDESTDDWFVTPIPPVPLFIDDGDPGDWEDQVGTADEDIHYTWIARGTDQTLNFLMEMYGSPAVSTSLRRAGAYLDCDNDGDVDNDPDDLIIVYSPSDDTVAWYPGDISVSDYELDTLMGQRVGVGEYLEWGLPLSEIPPADWGVSDCQRESGIPIGFFVIDVSTGAAVVIDKTDPRMYDIPNGNPIGNEVVSDFEAAPTSGVAPLDVDFTNNSTGDYDTCSWDFGDGGTSSVCTPATYTYNTPGVYTVSLMISGGGADDTETKTDYISVYEEAVAAFSGTPTSGVNPLDVDFTNSSTGDYDTCSWDFGDGGTSSECVPPTYTYNTPGTYTVALTVSGNGGEDTETKTDYITVNDQIQAEFSATPTSGVAPLDVDFTNQSSGDYDTCSWDFGDGGTSSECAPTTYTYNTPGTYTVSLTVSGSGEEDTETKTDYITVYKALADFEATPTAGVAPLDVDFTNNSTGDYDTCSWDFGDSGTSSECEPTTYTYNTPGVYTVSLTVSGGGVENTETKTDYVTVYEEAQADFSATPTTGIAPMDVDFTNTSTGDYDTCSWDFGDGGTSSVCAPPTYTYNTPGVYTVSLTVTGNGGEDTETKTGYITVYEEAQAVFSAAPTTGIAPMDVDFTNTSTGDYDTCSWDFGDGGISSVCAPPTYTYSTPGVYTVALTVSGNGGENTETRTDYITVYEEAFADFSATPTVGIAPLDVDFTNNSTGDYDTCSWDFGDGGTSNECEPTTYTYNTPGVYTVSLTISGGGADDTETKTDYITVYEAAQAAFSATPTTGIAPLDVDFTNNSTGDYDTCSWDFGDSGTSSECAPPTYTYNTPGTYTVALTVSGNGGEDTVTKTDYIAVYEEAQAAFSATPTIGIAPLDVDFTNTSTGDYDTCSWDFGDGGTSSVCAPLTYTYNTLGVYTVSLTVSGNGGEDTETKTDYITVEDPTHAEFSATTTSGVAPMEVDFTNNSTGDYDTCSWDFGDGGTSSECAPPTYTYNSPGVYTVALTVSGNGGEDTVTKTDYITVYEAAQAAFSAAPTSGVARLNVDFTNSSTGDYDTCSWDFGDSATYVSCGKLSHIYSEHGVYTVTLTVSGNGGEDTESKVDYIVVAEYYYNYMPIIMGDNSEAESTGIIQSVVDFLLNLLQ